MKKIILTLLLLSVTSVCAFANKAVKFVQVTDVMFKDYSLPLEKVIQDINRTPDIDFVVFTGNNIAKPNMDCLNNFLNETKHIKKPYYVLLGNKDISKTKNMDKKTYLKTVRRYNRTHPSVTNYSFRKGDIVFIVVDGSKELVPTPNGFYNKETIDWLDKQLTKNAKYKVVILQHFPLANKPKNEAYLTYNVLEYMQMLSQHDNVLAVISGHYDKNDEVTYNGVYHITTPSVGKGVYKIIDIDENGGVYTLLKEIQK